MERLLFVPFFAGMFYPSQNRGFFGHTRKAYHLLHALLREKTLSVKVHRWWVRQLFCGTN